MRILIYCGSYKQAALVSAAIEPIKLGDESISFRALETRYEEVAACYRSRGSFVARRGSYEFVVAWADGGKGSLCYPPDLGIDSLLADTGAYNRMEFKPADAGKWEALRALFNDRGFCFIYNAAHEGRDGDGRFMAAYMHSGSKTPFRRVHIRKYTSRGINEAIGNPVGNPDCIRGMYAARLEAMVQLLFAINAEKHVPGDFGRIGEYAMMGMAALCLLRRRDERIKGHKPVCAYRIAAEFTSDKGIRYMGELWEAKFGSREKAQSAIDINFGRKSGVVDGVRRFKGDAADARDRAGVRTKVGSEIFVTTAVRMDAGMPDAMPRLAGQYPCNEYGSVLKINKGDVVSADIFVQAIEPQPPMPYLEHTLLGAMKAHGPSGAEGQRPVGRARLVAGALSALVENGYVERFGGGQPALAITEKGKAAAAVLAGRESGFLDWAARCERSLCEMESPAKAESADAIKGRVVEFGRDFLDTAGSWFAEKTGRCEGGRHE